MSAAWVKLGAKCVCVRLPTIISPEAVGLCSLVKGAVYTVNDILDDGYIGLEELSQEVCASSDLFLPVVPPKSQEDDVSKFRHHLNTVEESA